MVAQEIDGVVPSLLCWHRQWLALFLNWGVIGGLLGVGGPGGGGGVRLHPGRVEGVPSLSCKKVRLNVGRVLSVLMGGGPPPLPTTELTSHPSFTAPPLSVNAFSIRVSRPLNGLTWGFQLCSL